MELNFTASPIRPSVEALLRDLQGELALLGVTAAYLFGSVARGEDTPASDIDIAVETVKPEDFMIDVRAAKLISARTGRKVDLTCLPLPPILAAEAADDLAQVF